MENQEIKEANRKAMPMFILLVIAGALKMDCLRNVSKD